MLSGEKILITGPAGQIAFPLARYLAADNEVWGLARFGDPSTRAKVDALGVTTRAIDLGTGDFGDLPDDFTYVLHLATVQTNDLDYDGAIRANAEGTGLLLSHCRKAKAALVMSTHSLYAAQEDPWHLFVETDPLGDSHPSHAPTYSVSKIAQEGVARYCARAFDLPVAIARMNASYGPNGGLPTYNFMNVLAGKPVSARWDPSPYRPIHDDDICGQTEAMLAAASVPATITNWGGDEPVTVQQWCEYAAELAGTKAEILVSPTPGTLRGLNADETKRASFTRPCTVGWKEGMKRTVDALLAAQP
jgi:nucleoside-diphosphate-sugar epimerase